MTEKEEKIKQSINELKSDYPTFYRVFIIAVGVGLSIPFFVWFIVWLIYHIGHYYPLIPTDISAGELLTFGGAIFSAISTTCLGALALWQNIKANSINKRLSLIERRRFKLELQPFVLVTDWKVEMVDINNIIEKPQRLFINIAHDKTGSLEVPCLTLFFTNTSNTYVMVDYSIAKVCKRDVVDDIWGNSMSNQANGTLYLESGHTGEIGFYCSNDKMKSFSGKRIELVLILKNGFDEAYRESLEIDVPVLRENSKDSWYVDLHPQRYKIERFDIKQNKYISEYDED